LSRGDGGGIEAGPEALRLPSEVSRRLADLGHKSLPGGLSVTIRWRCTPRVSRRPKCRTHSLLKDRLRVPSARRRARKRAG